MNQQQHYQQQQQCQVCFIDCMGYWDMASEIISLLILTIVILKTILNICNLNILIKQTNSMTNKDEQLTKSHKRKLIINLISLIYQLSLLITVAFSLIIFLVYKEDIRQAGENKLNLWYKWSEIIFINLLNCLNLTVGLLYWKAVRLYYKLAESSIPFIYNSKIKLLFGFFYLINIAIIIISLILLLTTQQTHYEQHEIKVINTANSIGVGCSTIVCLVNRLLYQRKILDNMSMGSQMIRKERVYSLVIAFAGGCRLACMVVNLLGIDYATYFRYFDEECLDSMPFHAIMMSLVTLFINITPPMVFNVIFSPVDVNEVQEKKRKHHYHQIDHYLCKHDQSVRYV